MKKLNNDDVRNRFYYTTPKQQFAHTNYIIYTIVYKNLEEKTLDRSERASGLKFENRKSILHC